MKASIYQIKNKITGHSYIGSTARSIETRFRSHINNSSNTRLKIDFEKFGIENFEFFLLEECDELLRFERETLFQKAFNPEYNIAKAPTKVPKKIDLIKNKEMVIHIRCSEAEWVAFKSLAANEKRSLSDWARLYLLRATK